MPRVACVMMQKDETDLLEPWLVYHGHLFGYENLSVIDHGSTSARVRRILQDYELLGVYVDRSHTEASEFSRKGEIVGARLRELDGLRKYDFLFPLDCDEFVVHRTESGFTCDKDKIHKALTKYEGEQRTLQITFQFGNVPGRPDYYCHFGFQKTFFAADTFGWTDLGFHFAGSWRAKGFRQTDITHIHFHHKPFALLIEHARRKLRVHIDPDDLEGLRNYQGRSMHLVPYLLMDEAEYYGRFFQQVQFYCPEFGRLMRSLGAPVLFGDEQGPPAQRRTKKPAPSASEADPNADAPRMILPVQFSNAEYLAANPDVASAGLDPLIHYCMFGFKERRPLRRS